MPVWHVQLLGGLRATRGNAAIAQFPSRPIALLLARLALQPQRRHAREELIDLLWPEVELEVGRNRLRQALSTLRRLVEPPDLPPDSVLSADRQTVGLVADSVTCDAAEFEQLLRKGAIPEALERYRGELLPGFLDEWVEEERLRLAALHERALSRGAIAPAAPPKLDTRRESGEAPRVGERSATEARYLPAYVSAFFDRETDKARVLDALRGHRLVALTGLGGFGKTRLAVESAREAQSFDAVAFVALGEVDDAALISDAIRSALRIEASNEDALAQLSAFLSERDILLVLDNFEQLVEDGTGVVMTLLERLPRLKCLVTSRRALDVPGERAVPIEPLPVPDASVSAAEAVAAPSVALFIDRARGARADFALTEDNREALVDLARALEGLPLAIEIAASRIRSYSPAEMRAALRERFDLLTRSGARGARYGRHASLESAIEWSWNLLSEAEKKFFAALSVFRGGSTVAAVEAVCAEPEAREHLEALVSDSLLRVTQDDAGVTRFSMLDTLREFAIAKLGEDAQRLRARHRAYFLEMVRRSVAEVPIAEAEMPNVKQSLVTAVEDADLSLALDLAIALRPYWEARGTLPDELRLLDEAASRCARSEAGLHPVLNLLAQLTLTAGDSERARTYAQRAVTEAGGDPARRAAALVTLARVTWEREQQDKGVVKSLDEALALSAKAGAPDIEADALRVKGTVAQKHGAEDVDHAAVDSLFERAEALYRRIGDPRWAHRVLLSRVGCMVGMKRYGEARKMLDRCERYFTASDSVADLVTVANMRGFVESAQERWQEAVDAGRRCVKLAWDRHAHLALAMALWNLPEPLARLGEFATAVRLMAFAARFWENSIGALSPSDVATIERDKRHASKQIGAREMQRLWAEGASTSLRQAVDLALTGRP